MAIFICTYVCAHSLWLVVSLLLPTLFLLFPNCVSADQVPSPSKPIVLHINISTVNVTWSWQGYSDVQFLAQVSVGTKGVFVNASQPNDKYYLIYGGMRLNEVYLFRVFAYQNGIRSAPSPTSNLLINGVNGECAFSTNGRDETNWKMKHFVLRQPSVIQWIFVQ